jgi:glycogen phosphorylase
MTRPRLVHARLRIAEPQRRFSDDCTVYGHRCWHPRVHQPSVGAAQVQRDDRWRIQAPVYLGELGPARVRVELYADPWEGQEAVREPMVRGEPLPGAVHGYLYCGSVPATRPAEHFTVRIVPMHPAARVPLEANHIRWQSST